jgi:predicted ATP-grasp superfamily ATP-dependent carboligase
MNGIIVHEAPSNKLKTMVVAFAGWPDAAEAATRAIRYMIRKLPTKKIVEIDPEEYYDFTVNRPQTRVNKQKERIIKWPCNEFYSYVPENDPENGLLLYVGTEPNLKWRTFSEAVLQVADMAEVELIISLGALLDAVPHTREVRITGRASSKELRTKAQWLGIQYSGYQGPTGIHSAFAEACLQRELPHANIWSHCPHYVQTSPNPIASYALLERLKNLVNFDIDMSELRLAGEAFQEEVSKAIAKQPDVKSYVSRLETQYDESLSASDEMPTGTDMVYEIEEFLRSQTGGQDTI